MNRVIFPVYLFTWPMRGNDTKVPWFYCRVLLLQVVYYLNSPGYEYACALLVTRHQAFPELRTHVRMVTVLRRNTTSSRLSFTFKCSFLRN